ncbi:hypothetical protein ACSBR1_015572 [Camellia fascicularis]
MWIIKSSFSFIVGTVCRIYIAQNYNVPNIRKLANTAIFMAKHIEEKSCKAKKGDDLHFVGLQVSYPIFFFLPLFHMQNKTMQLRVLYWKLKKSMKLIVS